MPTVSVSVTQLDHSASHAMARGHALTMDRPEAKGGQDKGPMGGEAMLMGLGGCFMSNLLAAALARDVALSAAKVEIEGDSGGGWPVRRIGSSLRNQVARKGRKRPNVR